MQEQKTEQSSNKDAVGRVLESRDILNGINANISSVSMETRLRKTERVQGSCKENKHGVIVMEDGFKREQVDGESYVSQQTVEKSMKSPFVCSDVVYGRESKRHVNEDTIINENKVIVDADPESEEDFGDFYICQVEHVVELTVSDRWEDERKLQKKFTSYREAESFFDYISEIERESAELTHTGTELTHTGDYFVVESDKIGSIEENRHISTIKRSVLTGFFIGLFTTILGFSWVAALISTSMVILLDIMNAYSISKKSEEFYFTEKTNKQTESIESENLGEMTVIEELNERFTVKVTGENVRLVPMTLDTEWTMENMSDGLPSEDTVEFFEKLGLEDLDDDACFTAMVQKRNTEPQQYCHKSNCGNWYIYPEKK